MADILRAIIIMSISGSILAVLLFALKPFVRNKLPKTVLYYLWLVVIVALIVPFSKLVVLPAVSPINEAVSIAVRLPAEVRDEFAMQTFGQTYSELSPEQQVGIWDETETTPNFWWKETIPLSLLSGSIYLLLYHILAYALFLRKLRRSNTATDIDCAVPVFRNAKAQTPMLIGLFRPAIILPDTEYTDEQLRAVLLHELTHLRRKDVLIKWLSVLACSVHWFNPIVWLVRREIDRACELACDEAVIRNLDTADRQNYGDTLIYVAADIKTPRAVLSTTMCEDKKDLKERLVAIMKNKKSTRAAIVVSAVLIVGAVLAACTLGAGSKDGGNTGITLPLADSIAHIYIEGITQEPFEDLTIEHEGKERPMMTSASTGVAKVADKKTISEIIALFSGANKTSQQSVNDTPTVGDFYALDIYWNNETIPLDKRVFLYSENGSYYAELPYEGIYKTQEKTFDKVALAFSENLVDEPSRLLYNDEFTMPLDWLGNLDGEPMTIEQLKQVANNYVKMNRYLTITDLADYKSINFSSDSTAYQMWYSTLEGFSLSVRADATRIISRMSIRRVADNVSMKVNGETLEKIDDFISGAFTPEVVHPLWDVATPHKVQWSEGGYQFAWQHADNPMLAAVSSLQYLPTAHFDDKASLEAYAEAGDKFYDFKELLDEYDEHFFDNNRLVLVYIEEGMGSIQHTPLETTAENGVMMIPIERFGPGTNGTAGTADMLARFIFIECDKEATKDIFEYRSYLSPGYQRVPRTARA